MEERKNNTGLVVLITVLVMLVLGMGAFIIYDKVINKTNEPTTGENNKVDDNEQNEENNNIALKDVVGKYSYVKKCEAVSGPNKEVEYYNVESYIILNEDNTFEVRDTTYCQTSVGYKGQYRLSENNIVLSGFEDKDSDSGYRGELNIFNIKDITKQTEINFVYNNNSLKYNNVILTK